MIILFRKAEKYSMKISERGQVTIPKELRDRFGLQPDVEIEFVASREGVIIRKRSLQQHPVDKVRGILKQPSESDAYIAELRGS
jgi:AbrB family looped-hinge helix DNA binding protein